MPDGSWYYSMDGKRDFVDHFHTCFVMKALAKIEELTGSCWMPNGDFERGVSYYLKNLFDARRSADTIFQSASVHCVPAGTL